MYTPEFRRRFVEFVPVDALIALRVATKGWNAAADALIDEGVESSEIIVHDGKGISDVEAMAREKRRKLVTRVIFPLNITKIGDRASFLATSLVIVDIPEGVESIGKQAFWGCTSLTTVSFPRTLTSIGKFAFFECWSLYNVDLLHTNLQELGNEAFARYSELKSMTIPDSLQKIGKTVLHNCPKLVPDGIDVMDNNAVVTYLRSQQLLSATPPASHADDFMATVDFRRLLVGFVHDSTLMALRCSSKVWKVVAEEVIDQGVESGEIIVHYGNNTPLWPINDPRWERRKLVTRVIFLLNITRVGDYACSYADNLVVVKIPEGVVSIGERAFVYCESLTTVSFPTTLKVFGESAFHNCSSLDNVDLLHTNLQVLGAYAFAHCFELKSMTIPDSLQTLGYTIFLNCVNLDTINC